jgi:transcriptional regulator with XRE-family HTH domain
MDMRQLVGRNTRRIRLTRGLTQEEFAELSGFSQQYLSDLERGRRNPTVVTLFELAGALGVNHIELLMPDEEFEAEASKRAKRRSPVSSRRQRKRVGRPASGG